jgi:hypothetical protein
VIAIALALLALVIATISLTATGTMAVRLRVVTPRPERPRQGGELLTALLPTRGRPVAELLGSLAEVTVPARGGPASMTDAYLTDDGCVLLVSTACGVCRYLVRESAEVLAAGPVRVLVAAPTVQRGIEFVERDCRGDGFTYQVDPGGERVRALGITEFPSVVIVAGGALAAAYIVGTPAHLQQAISLAGGHEAAGQDAEPAVKQGMPNAS